MVSNTVCARLHSPANLRVTYENETRRRFRDARRALNLSQAECAERLCVASATVENWERGTSRLPAWALAAVREVVL